MAVLTTPLSPAADRVKPAASRPAAAITFEKVTCLFGEREPTAPPYVAIRDVSLSVNAGEFVSIIGPTGCGKSTLLNVVAGLTAPSSGMVRVFDEPLVGLNRHAGYLFQTDALLPWRSALENVAVGLGIWSKVALGVTLVFFIVFFNVYQGTREVSPTLLANRRMLGASPRQLVRSVYLPSATSWVFASLHNSVGMAFVGAVIGEYLGSAHGVGYLILQAESVFDIATVIAGVVVLTGFALALDGIVGWAERALLTWQPKGARP